MQDRIDAARAANKLSYDRRIYFLHQMQAEMDEILNNPSLKAAHNAALDARTNIVFDLRGMGSIRISDESLEAYERALTLAIVPIIPPQVFKKGVIPKAVSTYTGDIEEPEALSQKASKRGITMPTFDNMFPPMRGGAGLLTGFESPTQVPPGLQGVYQELISIRSAIPSMGSAVVNAANQGALAQAQVQLAGQIKQQINDLNRLAIQYAGQVNAKPLEAQLVELNKRSFGMQASLGGYGATQYSAIGSVLDPIRDMTDRMRQGEKITQYQQQEVMRQASYDRARIALDPNLAESVKRNYSGAIASEQRRLQDIGRFNVLELPRGMPDEGIAGRFPGMMDRFQGMQGIRQRIEAARDATGRLRDDDQRSLRAQLDIEQRLLRVDEQRIRAAGDMTKEVQHQFNVQNSEINRSRRDLERAPTILTAGGAARMAAMGGGRALFGAGLQQLAFERGDVGGTGSLAMIGNLIQQRGIGGALIGGAEGLGARGALGLAGMIRGAPLTGSAAGIVGGLGSMAMLPLIGGFLGMAGGILSQVGPSTQHGMEVERLFRAGGARGLPIDTVGGISPNFISGYYREILNAAQNQGPGTGGDLAYSRDQVLGVAGTLAATGGTLAGGRSPLGRDRLRSVLEFSRYMGTDAQATAAQFGRQEAIGNTDTKQFADQLANSLSQTGLRGREQEVLGAVTDLTTTIARRGGTVGENQTTTNQVMGLLTAVGSTGVPGLQGAMGAQALGRMDQSITGATGIQRALLYGMYRNQPGGPQNFNQFIYEQAQGIGSPLAPGAVNQTMGLAGGDVDMGGILIGQMFGLTPQQGRALAQLSKDKRLTNESMQQAINTGGGVAGVGTPLRAGDQAGLGNAEALSDSMNRLENTFEDMASALQPAIGVLTNIVGQAAGVGTRLAELLTAAFKGDVAGTVAAAGGMFAGASQIVPPPGGTVTPPGGGETSPITPVPAYPPTPAPGTTPVGPYGPSIGFRGYFLPKAEGGFVPRGAPSGGGYTPVPNAPFAGPMPAITPLPAPPVGVVPPIPAATANMGYAALEALGAVGAPGVGRRLSDVTGGIFSAENIQALRNQPGLLVPQEGVDAKDLIDSFNATFPDIENNIPPYEEMVAFYNRWVEQHRDNIPQARGIAAAHFAGIAQRWANVHYGVSARNATGLAGVQAVRGGTTDCSGFVSQIYRELGIEGFPATGWSPDTSWYFKGNNAAEISRANIRVGDAIASPGTGDDAHMGIYIGNEQVAHMNFANNGVSVTSLDRFLSMPEPGGMHIRRVPGLQNRQSGVDIQQALGGLGALATAPVLPGVSGQELPAPEVQTMLPRLSGAGGRDRETGNPIATEEEKATYYQQAMQMALASGMTPEEAALVVGMGASESNYGNARTNNFFGMKASAAWQREHPGEFMDLPTWEQVGNRRVRTTGRFISLGSHREALDRFQELFGRTPAYGAVAQALHAGTMTAEQAVDALSAAHYQTDTRWPTTMRGQINRARQALPQSMVPGTGLYGSVPMGADALGAQQQMFTFAFQPATITLVDPSGNYVGSTQIAVQRTDAQSMVDRDPSISSNGYTNGNAIYTGGI
jgi:hypothetical protein